MAITVEIMYDDLSIVIKDISLLDTFQKNKILIILFKKDGFNIVSLMSCDTYYVKFAENILEYIKLNDVDGAIHKHDLTTSIITAPTTQRDQAWIDGTFIKFTGFSVDAATWNQALDKFATDMSNPVV